MLWHANQLQAFVQFLDTRLHTRIGVRKLACVQVAYALYSVCAVPPFIIAYCSNPFGPLVAPV